MFQSTRVLFVCVGNSCRSQIAEALARHRAADVIKPASAGVTPLGRIAEATRQVLLEKGIRMEGQFSKGLDDPSLFEADLIVNMSGIPGNSLFPRREVLDWEVADPYGGDMETHRRICDDIEARLDELASRLREQQRGARAASQPKGASPGTPADDA